MTSGLLVAWMLLSVAIHHPNYLAYFNELAGKNPQNILVDSNYDWGQDLRLLAKRLNELGVKEFALEDALSGDYCKLDLEAWYHLPTVKDADVSVASPGWTVIGPTVDKSLGPWSHRIPGLIVPKPWWDKMVPTERVGSLPLYHVEPANGADLPWNIPQPQKVVRMPVPIVIPARGDMENTYEIVPTGFTENKWVQFAEIRPSSPQYVHHGGVYVRPPNSHWMRGAPVGVPFTPSSLSDPKLRAQTEETTADVLLVYASGSEPDRWPSGRAKFIPAG